MQIRCPVCEYTREMNPDAIPATVEYATCPKCKHRFKFRVVDMETAAQGEPAIPQRDDRHADIWDAVDSLHEQWREQGMVDDDRKGGASSVADRDGVPWENPREAGFVPSFIRTTMWALIQPTGFFASLSRAPRLIPALVYYVLFGLFQFVVSMVWAHILGNYLRDDLIARFGEEHYIRLIQQGTDISALPASMISAPFILTMQVLVTSLIIHLVIRLVTGRRTEFARAFKVVCYAAAGFLLTIVPFVGAVLGPVWYLALLLIGCRSAFSLTWGKTLVAMVPLYVLMFLSASAQFAQFMG